LQTRASAGGIGFRLRVRPGARRDGIEGEHGGAHKVSVAAPPERGAANDAVVALLARLLGVSRDAVSIVSGGSSRNKSVRVRGLAREDLLARLTSR
jgi:uncharacterized protein (TIGR00251 family)